jgi:hypothetical protein
MFYTRYGKLEPFARLGDIIPEAVWEALKATLDRHAAPKPADDVLLKPASRDEWDAFCARSHQHALKQARQDPRRIQDVREAYLDFLAFDAFLQRHATTRTYQKTFTPGRAAVYAAYQLTPDRWVCITPTTKNAVYIVCQEAALYLKKVDVLRQRLGIRIWRHRGTGWQQKALTHTHPRFAALWQLETASAH